MECKTVLDWLDLGGEPSPDGGLPIGIQGHLADCPECQKEWEAHQQMVSTLARVSPGPSTSEVFCRKVKEKIQQKPGKDGFAAPTPFFFWKPAFAVLCFALSLLAVAKTFHPLNLPGVGHPLQAPAPEVRKPLPEPENEGMLLGRAKILREGGSFLSASHTNGFPLQKDDLIFPEDGSVLLFTTVDSYWVRISGQGEIRLLNRKIILNSAWKGTLTFSPCPEGMDVCMTYTILGIRGTTLHLRQDGGMSDVWLEEGVIVWKHLPTGTGGTMKSSEGRRFSQKTSEKYVKSLPEKPPAIFPVQTGSSPASLSVSLPGQLPKIISGSSSIPTPEERPADSNATTMGDIQDAF